MTIKHYLQRDDFFINEINDKDFLTRLARLVPVSRKAVQTSFPLDNFHRRLKVNHDGSCILLGDEGCLLPARFRPFYCRLYPFWFRDKRLSYLNDDSCLAQKQVRKVRDLMLIFGADPRQLKMDFHLMMDNLGLGPSG